MNPATRSKTNYDHGQISDKYGTSDVRRHLASDTNIAVLVPQDSAKLLFAKNM